MPDVKAPSSMQAPMGVKARLAEQTDAQTTIDREDADRHRRGKRTDTERRKPLDIYEDLSEVSVALLRGFLQNLIETKDQMREKRATAPPQAYAMQAYSHAQKTAPVAQAAPTVEDNAEIMGVTRLELAAEGLDRGLVVDLLDQLEKLEAAGIAFISIQKDGSFLGSIQNGINRALTPAE